MHGWLRSPAVRLQTSSLSAQRPALYEPPLTTSGSEKEMASLSMINFAIHLHMYVWIINQTPSCDLVWESRWHGCLSSFPQSPCSGRGCVEFAFQTVNFKRLAGVHSRSGYVEEMWRPTEAESAELLLWEKVQVSIFLFLVCVCVPYIFCLSYISASVKDFSFDTYWSITFIWMLFTNEYVMMSIHYCQALWVKFVGRFV